ncbi:MAG: aromatic amino acid lyase [Firmicutes bacterium]|nr:aromatic amino acid lyase [Bacillota bacterium]
MTGQTVVFDCKRLNLRELTALGHPTTRVVVTPRVWRLLAERRESLEHAVSSGSGPIYGATTGVGALKTHGVASNEMSQFNARMIRDHAAGYGEWLTPELSRLVMGMRLVELSRGGSGIHPQTFEWFLNVYNAGLIPALPQFGSVGEADITILAHMARLALGEGWVWTPDGDGLQLAGDALARWGFSPHMLTMRDGLALIGGNSYTHALTVSALTRWTRLSARAMDATALSWLAWQANPAALRPDIIALVDSVAAKVAQQLQSRLNGTPLRPRDIQDPLSWRCAPSVMAAALTAAKRVEREVNASIHASRDNPVVTSAGEVVSNGNFDVTLLAMDLDALRAAVSRVMTIQSQRVVKLLNHHYSQLTSGLALFAGDSGYGLYELTLSSILEEAQHLSQGPLLQSHDLAAGVEDYGSMSAPSAQKLQQLLNLWSLVTGIELLCATRALKLRGLPVGPPLKPLVDQVSRWEGDVTLAPFEQLQEVNRWLTEDPGPEDS